MQISVVIPTYNRAAVLKECIYSLNKQDLPKNQFEVIIVDDGSRDDTAKIAKDIIRELNGMNITYVRQKNKGQGIARNTGIRKAKGEVILLIGDDLMATKDLLSEHLKIHFLHPEDNAAVLGFTSWDPRLHLSPVMKWMVNGSSVLGKFGGHQFAYEKLRGKEEADYNFFYTINISLKRNILQKYPFDPEFSGYGWEDIELGYRLQKKTGMKIYYNPQAIGYHYHVINEPEMLERMYNIGKASWIIHNKYPELRKVPSGGKLILLRIISSSITILMLNILRIVSQGYFSDLYYYALSKQYFLKGLKTWKS